MALGLEAMMEVIEQITILERALQELPALFAALVVFATGCLLSGDPFFSHFFLPFPRCFKSPRCKRAAFFSTDSKFADKSELARSSLSFTITCSCQAVNA